MKNPIRKRDPRRGSSMVEFALAFMLFITLIFAAFDLGGAVWTYTTVTHAAKQAVRFATIHGTQNLWNGDEQDTDDKIEAIAKASAPGLDPDSLDVQVSWVPDRSRGSNVKVEVEYNHNFVVGSLLGLGNYITVKRSSTMLVVN